MNNPSITLSITTGKKHAGWSALDACRELRGSPMHLLRFVHSLQWLSEIPLNILNLGADALRAMSYDLGGEMGNDQEK